MTLEASKPGQVTTKEACGLVQLLLAGITVCGALDVRHENWFPFLVRMRPSHRADCQRWIYGATFTA